jgi:O-antigen/teichoic acid export membrane protein
MENKKKIVKFTYIYFVGILLFAICFAYLAKLFLPYFLGEKFTASAEFILYFSVAFAFQGMYFMVTNYIFYVKKTHILAYVTFGTAVLHVGLLYLFINANGAIGAAQASVISFAITFLIVWILASRVYKMPWRVWRA